MRRTLDPCSRASGGARSSCWSSPGCSSSAPSGCRPPRRGWARRSRQVREYATGARDQLRRELGPEFDELRKPLEDLRGLRDFNPRTAVRRTLFDDDPIPRRSSRTATPAPSGLNTPQETAEPAAPAALSPGERPPIDPDAT